MLKVMSGAEAEIGSGKKLFNLDEAQSLLLLVRKVTERHAAELEPLQSRLDRMLSNDPRRVAVEREFERSISIWRGKVARLGGHAAGLWVVEFDVGEGFLSWRYPELQIAYFRSKHDTIRKRLKDYIDENDPDWAL